MESSVEEIRHVRARAHRPFRCPICLDTYQDRVLECSVCANVFCASCIEECLKRKKDQCPMCRSDPSPLRRNKPIERLVAMLPEACPNLENGCLALLTWTSVEAHAVTCGYGKFKCSLCLMEGLKRDHDNEACAARHWDAPFKGEEIKQALKNLMAAEWNKADSNTALARIALLTCLTQSGPFNEEKQHELVITG
ncbi:hypothetical protein THRCLA_06913 [Thraustotheca clavata]|uniref:RING-type domain-containing protein n=1 Tax=Thraustotheca clavata TaxID=74557 RepID=A0A1V9ZHW2_9STRA|nr:hypothetical protein THRCLA_06913 [Thraustotheca clavata]